MNVWRGNKYVRTLAGLPTFWPIVFHLLFSYSLMAFRRAALYVIIVSIPVAHRKNRPNLIEYSGVVDSYLVFGKLCVVHVLFRYQQLSWWHPVGVEGELGCPTNLVPVLLHAALGTGGKRLCGASVARGAKIRDRKSQTLAISAQLLPESRICLSLSSSAGVQGVFVRFFFAGGGRAPSSDGVG